MPAKLQNTSPLFAAGNQKSETDSKFRYWLFQNSLESTKNIPMKQNLKH
jgi:hypothetical protein